MSACSLGLYRETITYSILAICHVLFKFTQELTREVCLTHSLQTQVYLSQHVLQTHLSRGRLAPDSVMREVEERVEEGRGRGAWRGTGRENKRAALAKSTVPWTSKK